MFKILLKVSILFLLLQFASARKNKTEDEIQFEKDHIECRKLENNTHHPLECCLYPKFNDATPDVLKKCSDDCRTVPYPDFRCVRHCIIFGNGVIYGGNLTNATALVKSFFEGGEDKEFVPLDETWLKVVEENAKFCENEIPGNKTIKEIPHDEDSGVQGPQHNFFYYNILVECIRKWNFVKCPNMKKSKECDELKNLMEICKGIDYPLTHKILHEDFFYRKELNYGRDYPKNEEKQEEVKTEEVTAAVTTKEPSN